MDKVGITTLYRWAAVWPQIAKGEKTQFQPYCAQWTGSTWAQCPLGDFTQCPAEQFPDSGG